MGKMRNMVPVHTFTHSYSPIHAHDPEGKEKQEYV